MVKVKYPIFHEAAMWTNIPYWKDMLEQCSLGKFPKGMSVSKNVIYINNLKTKKNVSKFDIPSDPKEVCAICKKIFTEVLGLKSDLEKCKDLQNFQKNQKEFKSHIFTDFKEASLKVQKEELIDNFVLRIGKEKGMSLDEIKRYRTAIHVGLHMKLIDPKTDFTFDDGEIAEIDGITLKKGRRGWVPKFK